jgi:hypothetical protein
MSAVKKSAAGTTPAAVERTQAERMMEIDVTELTAHPDNEVIFGIDEREQELLNADVKNNGVLVPLVVAPVDGHFMVLSGHRRLRAAREAGIEKVLCEVKRVESETYALMLLVSYNVGRGFKDTYKIRLFKGAKHFLCQLRENPDLMRSAGKGDSDIQQLVHAVHARGLKLTKGIKTWKIIEALFGIPRRDQDALTWLADEDYREAMLAKLEQTKLKKSKIKEVRDLWNQVEKKALNQELDYKTAVKKVQSYVREINSFINGKEPIEKETLSKQGAPKPMVMVDDEFIDRYGMIDDVIGVVNDRTGSYIAVADAPNDRYVVYSTEWLINHAMKV